MPVRPKVVVRRPDIPVSAQRAVALGALALALGAVALGTLAIGALAVGRLAIGRLVIKKARFGALEVDELTVRRLRVLDRDPRG